MSGTVSDDTSLLRLVPAGRYVAFGSYAFSEQEDVRRSVEAFFTLSHELKVLVLDGEFSLRGGEGHPFKLELELPRDAAGKGYFVFEFRPLTEIVGVLGHVDKGAYLLAGRSKEPPTQLACRLEMVDDSNLTLEGLLAYEDFKWVTWTLAMKTYSQSG